MSYDATAQHSTANSRVLVEADIGQNVTQWVNAGAGIWMVDFDNVYDRVMFVDATLIPGIWSTIDIVAVGSLQLNTVLYTEVAFAELSTTERSWHFDATEKELYVHTDNNDQISMFEVVVGVVFRYSQVDFEPVGSGIQFDGRLIDVPRISLRRDPLFFGRLTFPGFSLELINADGGLDRFAEDEDVYGNPLRVKHGYAELPYAEYKLLYTGYMGRLDIAEDVMRMEVNDRRSQLRKNVRYTCTAKNALEAIRELLLDEYAVAYNTVYYDVAAWTTAETAAPDITISMDTDERREAIAIIEDICKAVFGFFLVLPDGRFSFRMSDITATAETTIIHEDILSRHEIAYDPMEVISSVRVGHSYSTVTNAYTYATDTSREAEVFRRYRTYNEQTLETFLPNATAATALGVTILDYTDEIHGTVELTLPMKYHDLQVGDIVSVELKRFDRDMVGTKTAEVVSVEYNLAIPDMVVGVRFV